MSDHNQTNNEGQGFIAGAVIGALAGSIAAMLLTPKNGKEMREIVREYAKEWEGEAGDFAVEARGILAGLQAVIETGGQQFAEHAPQVANQAMQKTAEVAEVVEDGYTTSKDTVSEMVETFKSQWAELEEQHAAEPNSQYSRFRGTNRTWDYEPEADQRANEVYVEQLEEQVEKVEPKTATASRPTLAQYRQASKASPAKTEAKAEAKPNKKEAESGKKSKTGPRKSLFHRD